MANVDRGTGKAGAAAVVGLTIFFTAFIAVTYGFGIYLFPVIMSDMRADLGFTYGDAGVITASAQAGFLLAAFISAAVCARVGGGRVVIASVMICAASLLGLYVAENIWTIGILLTITGGMAASAYTPMVQVCQKFVGVRHRGKVLGLISSGTSYGVFVNGLLAPYMIQNAHWRDIWLTVGIGTAGMVVLATIYLAMIGVLRRPARPASIGLGVPRTPVALWWRMRMLFKRKILILWLMMFLSGVACISFQTYFSAYLRDELGYSVTLAGNLWTVIGFVGMGGGFAMGALADLITIRATMAVTYALLGLSSLLVLIHPDVMTLYGAAVAFGLAFYAIFGLNPAYISRVTTESQSTLVFGIGNIFLGLGSVVGNLAGGRLKVATETFEWTYILVAGVARLLCLLTLPLPDERRAAPPAADEASPEPADDCAEAAECPQVDPVPAQ
jgi:MFS family permease